jgi:hypothetical protein
VIEAQRRHFGYAEQTAGEQPPMPGDNLALAIDQDWDIEAEGPDAVGDLPDLFAAMPTRVGRIRREFVYLSINKPPNLPRPLRQSLCDKDLLSTCN